MINAGCFPVACSSTIYIDYEVSLLKSLHHGNLSTIGISPPWESLHHKNLSTMGMWGMWLLECIHLMQGQGRLNMCDCVIVYLIGWQWSIDVLLLIYMYILVYILCCIGSRVYYGKKSTQGMRCFINTNNSLNRHARECPSPSPHCTNLQALALLSISS